MLRNPRNFVRPVAFLLSIVTAKAKTKAEYKYLSLSSTSARNFVYSRSLTQPMLMMAKIIDYGGFPNGIHPEMKAPQILQHVQKPPSGRSCTKDKGRREKEKEKEMKWFLSRDLHLWPNPKMNNICYPQTSDNKMLTIGYIAVV